MTSIRNFSFYLRALLLVLLLIGILGWSQTYDRPQSWQPPEPTSEQTLIESDPASREELDTVLRGEIEKLQKVQKQYQDWLATPPSDSAKAWKPSLSVEHLAKLDRALVTNSSSLTDLRAGYLTVRESWRVMVRDFSEWLGSTHDISTSVPLPVFHSELYFPARDGSVARQYAKDYAGLYELRLKVQQAKVADWKTELQRRGSDAGRIGRLRTAYLDRLYRLGYVPAFDSAAHWSDDLATEIRIIPTRYRLLAMLAGLRYQNVLNLGVSGYYGALRNLAWLLLALLIPAAVFSGQQQIRRHLLENLRGQENRGPRPFAGRLFPWFVMLVILGAEIFLLRGTVLEVTIPVFKIVICYVLYRAYLEVVESQLPKWIDLMEVRDPVVRAAKAESQMRKMGLLVLFEVVLLGLLFSATGANLAYHFSWRVLMAINLLLYLFIAGDWRVEWAAVARRLLPDALGRPLSKLCRHPWLGRLVVPVMIPFLGLVLLLRLLAAQTVRFEWGRRASAGILRHWLEQTNRTQAHELESVDEEYKMLFQAGTVDANLFPGSLLEAVRSQIDQRLHSSNPTPPLSIVGGAGTGLTSLNDWIVREYQETTRVLRIVVPPRVVEPEAVRALIQSAVEAEGPALILVENAHNLFLAYPGGFEGVRLVVDLAQQDSRGKTWCLSLNDQSYMYLVRVLTNSSGFGAPIRIPPCSEEDLAAWILARHTAAGGKLRYGFSVLRTREEPREVKAAQDAYFRVLWQQVLGNRKVAQELWFKSLHRDDEATDTWLVDLPPRQDLTPLLVAPDSTLFVFTAIVRHNNLSEEEAQKVTSLSHREVRYAIFHGLGTGVLDGSEAGRFAIHPLWLSTVNSYLRRKNMLYDA